MNWSFGIVYHQTELIDAIVKSLVNQEDMTPSKYEILLVGPAMVSVDSLTNKWRGVGVDIKHIPFDESVKKAWTTRKKNIAVLYAKNENVCLTHDYVGFCKGWYKGFVEFGGDWNVCMNPIRFPDNKRFRDWIRFRQVWGDPEFVSYYDESKTSEMYVSGTYWCAKKEFMMRYPLNENLTWGQGEDLEWSHRCRLHWRYRMNFKSAVKILKEKLWQGKPDYCPHPDTDPNKDTLSDNTFELQD